ncbi:hypothetical protein LTV02_28565 [Nocardia yamanashiensis]|uniref:hypothetical protein n=1 Tax=Nocardia yamanashiensis TaxID=209247 RepID=UPI001E434A60|nr:hypothetical protein [Nocardia yamanashiensis]UGT39971.1 hypothetical protein LTV02_28565 [Nocardia yamanashiensis]
MRVSFLFGGQVTLEAAVVEEFHRRSPAVRKAYAEAAAVAGLPEPEFRVAGADEALEDQHSRNALRHTALTLGLVDDLAEQGVEADAVGGLSLGALIGVCVAGAIERHELYAMLHQRRLVPPADPGAPEQGMMLIGTAVADRPENYYGPAHPGVHLAVDTGPVDLERRSFVVSGRRSALLELQATAPEGVHMFLFPGYHSAFHSPLQQPAADFMKPFIDAMTFRDPKVPICSPVRRQALTTATEVHEFMLGHNLLPARYEPLVEELAELGSQAALLVGPGLPAPVVQPFPVELFTQPSDFDRRAELLELLGDIRPETAERRS